MKIKMTTTVRSDLPFLQEPELILISGNEYEAKSNKNGAISGLCENGFWLGVKPHEFEFVDFPIISSEFDRRHLIHYLKNRIQDLHPDREYTTGVFDTLNEFLGYLQIQDQEFRELSS